MSGINLVGLKRRFREVQEIRLLDDFQTLHLMRLCKHNKGRLSPGAQTLSRVAFLAVANVSLGDKPFTNDCPNPTARINKRNIHRQRYCAFNLVDFD